MNSNPNKSINFYLRPEWVKLTPNTRLHQLPCPVIGLTGGVASGKSTVSTYFESLGLPIVSADVLIKKIYQQKDVLLLLKNIFPEVFNKNGEINFKELRNLVFNQPDQLALLEKTLYPFMPTCFHQTLTEKYGPNLSVVVYDVPLLFEKSLHQLCDLNVTVDLAEEKQVQRLKQRDQISDDLAKKMMSQQLSLQEKVKLSDFIIDNNGNLEDLKRNCQEFIHKIFIKKN